MGSSPTSATIRPVGQEVKTPPFHGSNMGSIPVRVTKRNKSELFRKSKLVRICFLYYLIFLYKVENTYVHRGSRLFLLKEPFNIFTISYKHHRFYSYVFYPSMHIYVLVVTILLFAIPLNIYRFLR